MAADLETKPDVPRYEAFVDKQLARVRTRIRALDAGRSVMMLGVVTLAYFLLSAAFDLAVKGADDFTGVRLAAFGMYVVLMVVLAGQLGLRLYRRVNPYYAAKQLEDTIPGSKNSVINWLDLKEEQLPGAIRGAVGQRAARELKQTDPDKVMSAKGNWALGGVLAGLAVGLLILFALGPNQFGSLWQRAFTPFLSRNMDAKAQITLLRPAAGHATVPLNLRVEFQAQIDGRFPKAGQPGGPRLLYRYLQSDDYVPLILDEDLDGKWNATLLGDQVQNGFWYKIAAGDTETPEYQVKVQSLPQATRFEATYHYRPYRKLGDEKVIFPNEHSILPLLHDYRGTEVALVVRTNRELRTARVEVESGGVKKELVGEILPGDPKALEVRMTLEQRGTFRVYFTSRAGEENIDRSPYQIEVLDDEAPRVVLTKPGQDVSLAVGGTLPLEGSAQDDIGIKSMALRLQVLGGGPPLEPKAYRSGTSFQFDDGTYPDFLEYKDFLALDKVTTTMGEAFPLKAGMVLEYWLEATDNSDYPSKDGNVGKSQAFKITILDKPSDGKKHQEDRKQAEQQQKNHEQMQDQKNGKENQKRNNQGSAESQQGDQKKDDIESKLEKVRKEINKDKEDQQKGDSKGQEPKSGENKPGNNEDNDKADQKGADSPKQAGEKKDAGKQGQGDKAGEAKDQGTKDSGEQKPSEAKGPGAGEKQSAGAKGSDNKSDQTDKGAGKEQPKPGQSKNEGQPGAEKPSKSKGSDAGNPSSSGQAKEKKDGAGDKSPQAKGDKKGDQQGAGGQADSKANSKGVSKEQAAQGQAKGDQGTRPDAGAAKEGPSTQTQPQGQAKGNEDGKKAETKVDGQNPRLGKKEGNAKESDAQASRSKEADPHAAKDSGTAKNDQPADTNPRDAVNKNIADLKEKLKNRDQAKEAVEELSRLAKDAKDPSAQKAAKELLDSLGQQTKAGSEPLPKDKKTTEAPAQADPKKGDQEGQSESAKGDGSKTGDATVKDTQNPKDPRETKPGDKVGSFGEGGKGAADDITPQPPNADFARRGSDMQLEDLKKRMTPEILKRLNWSESDWQKFLKDAKDYQDRVSRPRTAENNFNKRGQTSQLPGTGLRAIDGKPNEQVDPLQADGALPPPEFRDAQRQFTTNPPGKKQ